MNAFPLLRICAQLSNDTVHVLPLLSNDSREIKMPFK